MLAAVLVLGAVAAGSGDCRARSSDDFIERMQRYANEAMPAGAASFKQVAALERLREIDRAPLSIALFGAEGNRAAATRLLELSLFGGASAGAVRVDLRRYARADVPLATGLQDLRRELLGAARRCAGGRALVVLEGAHALAGERVQLLDALMGLLDGGRATLADHAGGGAADTGGYVVLLPMPALGAADSGGGGSGGGSAGAAVAPTLPQDWRERLEGRWSYAAPQFTAGALV
eukprot:g5426.t1